MYLEYVRDKIAGMPGVLNVEVGVLGELNVYLDGHNRDLREEVLEVGCRTMLPVRVFYKMSDGQIFGEALEDYYKPLHVPGFAGSEVQAPPDEVAADPKGALKLKRLRGKTRGRPVVGWKYGDKEIRKGTEISFKDSAALQWTMGRVLNVKPGSKGKVTDLSTNRPLVYLQVGSYDGIELPVHAIGHVFEIDAPKKEKAEDKEPGYRYTPELDRLINTVGFGRLDYSDGGNDPVYNRGDKNQDDHDYDEEDADADEEFLGSPNESGSSPHDQRFGRTPARSGERVMLFGKK